MKTKGHHNHLHLFPLALVQLAPSTNKQTNESQTRKLHGLKARSIFNTIIYFTVYRPLFCSIFTVYCILEGVDQGDEISVIGEISVIQTA